MRKKEKKIICTIELTEGAEQRLTDALVDLYYGIKDGIYEGPLLPKEHRENEPA